MNDKDQITDQDIDNYLNGKDELSAVYSETSGLKAPDHLEFKIKQMAREAERPSDNRPIGNKNAWYVPLAIAATVIIAIVLVVFLDTQDVSKDQLIAGDQTNVQQEQTATIDDAIIVEPKIQRMSPPNSAIDVRKSQTEPVTLANKLDTTEPDLAEQSRIKQQNTEPLAKQNQDFELPPHLKEMVQPTRAGSTNELPPPEILKTWNQQQWREQILALQKAGKTKLADRYLEQYAKYFPGQKLDLSN